MSGPLSDLFTSDASNTDDVRPASTLEDDGGNDGMNAAADAGPPSDDWLEPQSGVDDASAF